MDETTRFPRWVHISVDVVLYFLTIGFYPKYRDRLYVLETLDPAYVDDRYERYSEPPTFSGLPYRLATEDPLTFVRDDKDESFRARQAEEWNKISTATSVIAATSAAALSIQDMSGAKAYWMVNTCYCAALGISLEGLILTFYLMITLGGTSDETIGRMARGDWKVLGIPVFRLIPIVGMACPVLYATYSAMFLLVGTTVMVAFSQKVAAEPIPNPYYYLALVAIGYGFLCMAGVIGITELGLVGIYHSARFSRAYGPRDAGDKKRREILRRSTGTSSQFGYPTEKVQSGDMA